MISGSGTSKIQCGICRKFKLQLEFEPAASKCIDCNESHEAELRSKGIDKNARSNSNWANNLEKSLLESARRRAKKKGLDFNIDIEDIDIPSHCPVLGVPIFSSTTGRLEDSSPTLDRINPNKGYIKGNVCVISWKANRIKSNASPLELQAIATYTNVFIRNDSFNVRDLEAGYILQFTCPKCGQKVSKKNDALFICNTCEKLIEQGEAMNEFKCSKCGALVTKGSDARNGCPCCGFKRGSKPVGLNEDAICKDCFLPFFPVGSGTKGCLGHSLLMRI